ncbi:hypothetical protein Pcinc_032710 [Petrolisthes cinctipes]|uniref:Uncharacterized protein n=1 Tax=Petrolisthes cinctipes TaxID=88211 RepID=A0AAE1ETR1_PETCI|nr:hypothetical protein Pcinc_032710 [Petrolisthes cinctipes]
MELRGEIVKMDGDRHSPELGSICKLALLGKQHFRVEQQRSHLQSLSPPNPLPQLPIFISPHPGLPYWPSSLQGPRERDPGNERNLASRGRSLKSKRLYSGGRPRGVTDSKEGNARLLPKCNFAAPWISLPICSLPLTCELLVPYVSRHSCVTNVYETT